ncbi:MAG: cytochrome C [Deltaproteobacteria bacterium]|nr:cytochrome C [Deltaproteobacteria bacterium]
MKKIAVGAAAICAMLLAVFSAFTHQKLAGDPHYITSAKCAGCHELQHASWQQTLHPKMFRPVKRDSDILGDFSKPDPNVTFKKEDIQFVVGNKWEQVYVRMIDGEYYPLTARWMVMQNKWTPFKVQDWKETPMTKKCNGCHTTGFDPATGKFAEFGIGCEACHGPGSRHAAHRQKRQWGGCALCHDRMKSADNTTVKDIVRTVAPSVCGQCHTRGQNSESGSIPAGKFDFPVNNMPDADFTKNYKEKNLKNDAEKKFWWGYGVSKDRHQEYADWSNSKHAKALKNLQEDGAKRGASCSKGKRDDQCMDCHSADFHLAKNDSKPTMDTARYGVTCVSCHEPHGLDQQAHVEPTNRCGNCHLANFASRTGAAAQKPHAPCPAGKVGCADCHMPRTVKTGGFYSLRSHAFRIVPPQASLQEEIPNSCQNSGCHKDKPLDWAIGEFDRHYPGAAEKFLKAGKN